MGFLKDDEYFLLMDGPLPGSDYPAKIVRYSDNDIMRLVDAGIETTIAFSFQWDQVESAFGVYDWTILDDFIERRNKMGMKVWLLWFEKAATWFPRDWYIRVEHPMAIARHDMWAVSAEDNIMIGQVSPWNSEAWAYNLNMYRMVRDRYSSPNCMVVNGWLTCGETVLVNEPAWFDPAALASHKARTGLAQPIPRHPFTEAWLKESYIRLMTDIQKVLIETPYREIYTALHPMISRMGFYGNGCNMIGDILAAYRALAPAALHHVYYTWLQWPFLWPEEAGWRDTYGEQVWGGAEYCEGIRSSTPKAIANGLRGQFIGPCDFRMGLHSEVNQWMQDEIEWAMDQWRRAKGG